jgi:hypothetical protein
MTFQFEETCIELGLTESYTKEELHHRNVERGEDLIRELRGVIDRARAAGEHDRVQKLENRLRTAEADLDHMRRTGEYRQIHV